MTAISILVLILVVVMRFELYCLQKKCNTMADVLTSLYDELKLNRRGE